MLLHMATSAQVVPHLYHSGLSSLGFCSPSKLGSGWSRLCLTRSNSALCSQEPVKTSCSFSTSDDEQLKLRFMVNCGIPRPMGEKTYPKVTSRTSWGRRQPYPFAHKQINLLGTGNQLTRDTGRGKEGIRLSFLSTSFQKLLHLKAKGLIG